MVRRTSGDRTVGKDLRYVVVTQPLDPHVAVTVPSEADFVHVLRAVTSSVAARLELPLDDIDDLRLAIDEACAQLLSLGSEGGTLTLRLQPREGWIEAVVSVIGDVEGRWPPRGYQDTLAWKVLSGLSDEVEFGLTETGPSIRIVKRPSAGNTG